MDALGFKYPDYLKLVTDAKAGEKKKKYKVDWQEGV
jgi:hypothetical protein